MENNNITPKSKFQLRNYLIEDAHIKITNPEIGDDMETSFNPSGSFDEEKKQFHLVIEAEVNDKDKNFLVKLRIHGVFLYETTDMQKLKTFIGLNAPAILFPYLRAYVSNITALSGMQPIIMPTLNLSTICKDMVEKLMAE